MLASIKHIEVKSPFVGAVVGRIHVRIQSCAACISSNPHLGGPGVSLTNILYKTFRSRELLLLPVVAQKDTIYEGRLLPCCMFVHEIQMIVSCIKAMFPYRIKCFGEVQTNCNCFHFGRKTIRGVYSKGFSKVKFCSLSE